MPNNNFCLIDSNFFTTKWPKSQIHFSCRKRSESDFESTETQTTEATSTSTSPKPEVPNANTIETKTTLKDKVTNPTKEGENYKVINLLTSAEHFSHKQSTKALVTKSTPNDTTEEFFPNSNIPPLRHHKNHHHHNRRKLHNHKASSKTKRDKVNIL